MKILPYVLGPITIICTIKMSAGVTLYFACTSIFQYIQTSIFLNPNSRGMMGLPPLTPSSPSPNASATRNGQYQAPRTIKTTAKEADGDKEEGIFDIYNSVRQQVSKAMGAEVNSDVKKNKKISDDYEARRKREEAEEYFARRDAASRGRHRKR